MIPENWRSRVTSLRRHRPLPLLNRRRHRVSRIPPKAVESSRRSFLRPHSPKPLIPGWRVRLDSPTWTPRPPHRSLGKMPLQNPVIRTSLWRLRFHVKHHRLDRGGVPRAGKPRIPVVAKRRPPQRTLLRQRLIRARSTCSSRRSHIWGPIGSADVPGRAADGLLPDVLPATAA